MDEVTVVQRREWRLERAAKGLLAALSLTGAQVGPEVVGAVFDLAHELGIEWTAERAAGPLARVAFTLDVDGGES